MRSYVDNKNIGNSVEIVEDYNHIVNVLRLKVGDNIIVFNNTNFDYECKITKINKKSVECEVINKIENKIKNSNLTVFQALLKGEKLDFLIQKLTEMNIENLNLFLSNFTISKWKEDKKEKLNKISIEACKQCGRSKSLNINYVGDFNKMLTCLNEFDLVIFAYEKSTESLKEALKNVQNKKVAIIIGSEGGFSNIEAEALIRLKNVKCVSLGSTILRAETASLYLSSIVNFCLNG